MDPSRIPVVASVGQAIERSEIVDVVELAGRAADAAFDGAPRLRERIERLSMIAVSFSPVGKAPASQVAERLGLEDIHREVTTPGGNMPQWLVTRAASDISSGRLGATLIVGAEATRSMRAADPDANFLQAALRNTDDGPSDENVGPSINGMVSEAEIAARLFIPGEVYALLESARAHAAGRSFEEQRRFLGPLMSNFSRVASRNPFAWFQREYKPEEISEVTPDNRLIAEPYVKRMNSFPNVDQASALIVTSLAAAREAGVEDRCVFVWSGASVGDPPPATRPDLGESPGMRAAAAAALASARVGADDLSLIDFYSCFPIAVQAGASALGIELDDPRGLTVTGGLPFFGGPGNNYSGHAIASMVDRLREAGGLGYIGANGGFLSKHSIGIYGTTPPPHDFAQADTADQQEEITAAALPTAIDASGTARVVAGTVVYDRDGTVASAPIVATLEDGRRVAAQAEPSLLNDLAGSSLVGRNVRVSGSPPLYEV
ncbi:MAG: acetyl-CoA acetyltransferase [Deltaproteobacteria bacterium]|nr:acetyl-CoA acetyltransferase [Deltaproteobacteria bacterium]